MEKASKRPEGGCLCACARARCLTPACALDGAVTGRAAASRVAPPWLLARLRGFVPSRVRVPRSADTDFKQQRLKAWQPLLTPQWVIGSFLVIGCVFLPIGAVVLSATEKARLRTRLQAALVQPLS
jgi:hypothetical protein